MLAAPGVVQAESASSQFVTWSCTSSPCPWGATTDGHAVVWPASMNPISARLGYTVSQPIYLPASQANGLTVTLNAGSAAIYAGTPQASGHRFVVSLNTGQPYTISGIAADEVVSIQFATSFTLSHTTATPPPTTTTTTAAPTTTTTAAPTTTTATTVPPSSVGSQFVTWSCTSSPCPWGPTTDGHAFVWPASMNGVTARLGYTVSQPIYLPASEANGLAVILTDGSAAVYAGAPQAAGHRFVSSLTSGQPYTINGIAPDEVVSIQFASAFALSHTTTTPPPTTTTTAPTTTTTTTTTTPPTTTTTTTTAPTTTVPTDPNASRYVTWSCTSSPCPWGPTTDGHAYVWPASMEPTSARLGYTVSQPIYLPGSKANGLAITLTSGGAAIYAGTPQAGGHRFLTSLNAGQSYTISGIAADEVVSVQNGSPFGLTFEIATPVPTCTDPLTCELVTSVRSLWRCDLPGCASPDWIGGVITWPSWAAYSSNARQGDNSRTVVSASTGETLYAYMGAWASGCKVTAVSGQVLIVEWQRGTDIWRSTYLSPGQSHVISLTSPEDNALLETPDTPTDFTVRLENCNPQPIAGNGGSG